jgi:hypothetical protein
MALLPGPPLREPHQRAAAQERHALQPHDSLPPARLGEVIER